jgi:N-methylhydantoinase A
MNYRGQTHTLRVVLPPGVSAPARIDEAFEEAYARRYGRSVPGAAAYIVNLRSTVIGHREETLARPAAVTTNGRAHSATRMVRFDGTWTETPVLERLQLSVGHRLAGPAILEQPGSTTVIEPGARGLVDKHLNVLIELEDLNG